MDYMVKMQQAGGPDFTATLYEKILSTLIINQAVPVEAMYTLWDNYSYIAKMIQRGVDGGDIKKKKLSYRQDGKEYTVTVLTISKKGFQRYATSLFSKESLEDIDFKSLSLSGGNGVSKAEYTRQVQMSEARIISSAAGAAVKAFPASMINEKRVQGKSYVSILKKYIEENQKDLGRIIIGTEDSSPDIMFHNNREVKNIIEPESRKLGRQVMGFQRCMFNGIIESQFKTVLMYSPYSVGFRWGRWEVQEDVRIGKLWSQMRDSRSAYIQIADEELQWGMFFVKNRRQFGQYYRDDAKRRSREAELGVGFEHFYAVPKSLAGAKLIRFLMLTHDDKYNLGVANGLISGGKVEINGEASSDSERKLFPVKDHFGNPICIGIQMDVRKIQKIEKWKAANGGRVVNIVCFDWQREYYEEVLDNIRTTVIPVPDL